MQGSVGRTEAGTAIGAKSTRLERAKPSGTRPTTATRSPTVWGRRRPALRTPEYRHRVFAAKWASGTETGKMAETHARNYENGRQEGRIW